MAKYSIEDTSLTAIADAIRAKTGKEDALTLDGMAAAVAGLNVAGKNVEFIGLIDRTITEAVSEDVTEVGAYAFYNCAQLENASFPNATGLEASAFNLCQSLESVNFPNATDIGNNAFSGCSALESVNFPSATTMGASAFNTCKNLVRADFGAITTIQANAFNRCSNLEILIIRSNVECSLSNITAFMYTPMKSGTGYIYVPAALVDSYKAATNWSTYADQIRAIEDYPDITGGAA